MSDQNPEAPVDPSALSKSDRDKIVEWLRSKTKSGTCPVCQTQRWTVGAHLLHGQIATPGGGIIFGGGNYPLAFVVCDNCFYVRTFMAVPLELDATKEPEGDA